MDKATDFSLLIEFVEISNSREWAAYTFLQGRFAYLQEVFTGRLDKDYNRAYRPIISACPFGHVESSTHAKRERFQ